VISGFRNEVLRTALFWVITHRVVVISYRPFRKSYRYYPQGSRILKPEDGTDSLSQTSVRNYHLSLRNNPE